MCGLRHYNGVMSLTNDDLIQVRDIVVDAVTTAIQTLIIPRLDEQDKRLEAIEEDIRGLKEDVRTLKAEMHDVKDSLDHLEGRLDALEADVKELYAMVSAQKPTYADRQFAKLPVEQKVLKMYEDVKLLAREAGVTLPN